MLNTWRIRTRNTKKISVCPHIQLCRVCLHLRFIPIYVYKYLVVSQALYTNKSLGANFDNSGNYGMKTIIGRVVLVKKNLLDINDLSSSVLDRVHELLGKNVTLQLISAHHPDHQFSGYNHIYCILILKEANTIYTINYLTC